MPISETDRLRTKLHALHMRLAELNLEMERTRIQAQQMETRIEDARLAALFGQDGGEARSLEPQLEEMRHHLQGQEALIASVKDSQSRTRIRYMLLRQREQREQREREKPV